MKKGGFFLILFLLSALPLQAETEQPKASKKTVEQEVLEEVRIDPNPGVRLPLELEFLDEEGNSVKLGDFFRGKPVIITPVYYQCPMLCTLILNDLVSALKEIDLDPEKDFNIISYTIDPGETPDLAAKKKETYLESYGHPEATSAWNFLTGEEAAIKNISDLIGFHYKYDEQTDLYAHAALFLVAAPDGTVTHYFTGLGIQPRDLRLALVEASRGKIGSFVDRVLLLCYHYDPSTGKYGFVITNILRIAGALTVMGLVAGFLLMSKKKKA